MKDPHILEHLFRLPIEQSSTDSFRSSLLCPTKLSDDHPMISKFNRNSTIEFVQRYFGEGRRPIVWFGQANSTAVLWLLLRGLWPKLRASFSCCTYSLQPRILENQPFDVMFAPRESYPRFLKMNSEHIIDSAREPLIAKNRLDEWCQWWTKRLFSTSLFDKSSVSDLWNELDDDPTLIRRLFLVESLTNSSLTVPQEAVSVMDLVESMANSPNAGVTSKRRAVDNALRVASDADEAVDGLECLLFIEDRLRRPAYSTVEADFGCRITDVVSTYAVRFPELTIEAAKSITEAGKLGKTWFGHGLLRGLQMLMMDHPKKLNMVRLSSSLCAQILQFDYTVAIAYIGNCVPTNNSLKTREFLLSWVLCDCEDDIRRALRKTVLPFLGAEDADLLSALLKNLGTDDVADVLDILLENTETLSNDVIGNTVIQLISQKFQTATREWASQREQWNEAIAYVIAGTFAASEIGLRELITCKSVQSEYRPLVLAEFLQRARHERFPIWLKDTAQKNPCLIATLLQTDRIDTSLVARETENLLAEVSTIPIVESSEFLPLVLRAINQPYFDRLIDITVRTLIRSYVLGTITEEQTKFLQNYPKVASWIEDVRLQELRTVLIYNISESVFYWYNVWRWLENAPLALYKRKPAVLPDLIDSLVRIHCTEWSPALGYIWANVLKRSRSECKNRSTILTLCVQALEFAFKNTRFPLGAVVAESFYEVYVAVTESSVLPVETESLFRIFDWDKGKELRRKLVNAFTCSEWPPGDIAVAASNPHLLRKIFKRLIRRTGGESYCKRVLEDLSGRANPNAKLLADEIRQMLRYPDFFEAWD